MSIEEIFLEFESLKNNKNIKTEVIGKSELGQNIYSFSVGNNPNKVIIVEAGLHAREYITTFLCIKLIKLYAEKKLDFEICFVPLANPDGVGLCLAGKKFLSGDKKRLNKLVKINKNSNNFSLWKANINAVDLNVNFDALWSYGKSNKFMPASESFVGFYPESEKEVVALKNLAINKKPYMIFCFHSKGEVIYYGFEQIGNKNQKRDLCLAKEMQRSCGYKPVKTKESVGGFSDWVSTEFDCPAFTIEVGNNSLSHPISKKNLPEIYNQTKHIILIGVNAYDKFVKNKKSL